MSIKLLKTFLFLAFLMVSFAQAGEGPICSVCGKSGAGKYFQLHGEYFCSETCIGKKYSCVSCGIPLTQKFHTIQDINEQKLSFCSECMKKTGCEYCGSRKDVKIINGRPTCVTCLKTAINRTEDACPILEEAQDFLKKHFDFKPNRKIRLEVVNASEFAKQISEADLQENAQAVHITHFTVESQLSYDEKTLTLEIKTEDSGMLVLMGAPRACVFDSIIHELTHDFLRRKFGFIDDPLIEEGFCEVIAGISSTEHGNPTLANNRFENQDPIYGEGFRKMYEMLEKQGWEETLSFIKAHSLTRKKYVLKNLYECLDEEHVKYLKKNHLKPKIIFGKLDEIKK